MQRQRPEPSAGVSLRVEDFGPIARADIEWRPLTVFAGPGHTGKSYLATLAYALQRSLGYARARPGGRGGARTSSATPEWTGEIRDWLSAPREGGVPPPVPERAAERLRPFLERAEDLDRHLDHELARCFGVEHPRDLIRRAGNHRGARISLGIPRYGRETPGGGVERGAEAIRFELELRRGRRPAASGRISVSPPLEVRAEYVDDLPDGESRPEWPPARTGARERERAARLVGDALLSSLFHPLNADAFYLPAGRTGVLHVASALRHGAAGGGRRPTAGIPALSGVRADLVENLIALGRGPRPDSAGRGRRPLGELAGLLEQNVLGGGVGVGRGEGGDPIASYRPAGGERELPITRASSSVSELAPVALYLRHLVRPGDLLIIEEPESHLHPATQAAFARELARLVRAGVRVLLTTHSEWFLEQIGNLVRLSALPESRRAGLAGADVALRPAEVGVWLFEPRLRPRGAVVSELGLDEETGLYPAGYGEVGEALYNEGAEIFNRLQAERTR